MKHTALDGIALGFRVFVLTDAIKGVELSPGDSHRALKEMELKGAERSSFGDMVAMFRIERLH